MIWTNQNSELNGKWMRLDHRKKRHILNVDSSLGTHRRLGKANSQC